MGMEPSSLVVDYVVFAAAIVACSLVAVWQKFRGPKETTKADYVFATGTVSMGAMMLSIARGTLGVRSFLGYPSELYYRGAAMWETVYGMVCAFPIVIFVFVPVYYNLGITSVYQYLDMRFKSRAVRCLASGTYVIRSVLNLGVTVFTPCVALKTVIGLPYWASIVSITTIGVGFTIMGGLKAAITADVIQGLLMIGISLAVIVQGTYNAGGIGTVVEVSNARGRLDFFNFNMDPTIRVTTVSAFWGQLFMSLSIFGCQQNFVQRYVSMNSQSKVTKTLMANIPIILVLFSLSWVAGMAIFANYSDCDPLTLGYTSKIDEIVPFFVEDNFLYLPGVLGMFMACLFNGALNLVVSNLNSLATVTWEDFLSQVPQFKSFDDRQQLLAIKTMSAVYGVLTVGIAFGVAMFSGVIESSQLMTSATSGPLLGVFLLAMLFPSVNWKGAVAGMLWSHIIILWITFGGWMNVEKKTELLDLTIAGCDNSSFNPHIRPPISEMLYNYTLATSAANSTFLPVLEEVAVETAPNTDFLTSLYSVTYMYYSLLGSGITVIVGVLVSYIVGTTEEDEYDEKLIHPLALKLSSYFPGPPRRYINTNAANMESGAADIKSCEQKISTISQGSFDIGKYKKTNNGPV